MSENESQNAKILIVDDQEANTLMLEKILQRQGFEQWKSLNDSRLVVDTFKRWRPDLLLLDLMMPHMSGFAVMDALKPLIPKNEFFPILVLTADITAEAKQRALSEGAMDFLTKPFDISEVILRINNLLRTRALHKQLQNQNATLEDKVLERTAQLTESEARNRAMLNAIPDLIFLNDQDGVYLECHAPNLKDLLLPPEKFVGKTIREVLPPELADVFMKNIKAALQTGEKYSHEYSLMLEDGLKYFETRFVRSGEKNVLMLARNITERKKAQEELHERIDDLALINALNVAVNQGMDIHQIIVLLSEKLERIFNCIGTITSFPDVDQRYLRAKHIQFDSPLAKEIEKLAGASLVALPIKIEITGAGQIAQVMRDGLPIAFNDAEKIKSIMAEFTQDNLLKSLAAPVYDLIKFRSMILIPLISGKEIYGLLEVARAEPTTAAELKRVEVIAGQLTAAIGRLRTEEQTRQRLQNIQALRSIDQAISGSLDLRLTFSVVLEHVLSQLNVDAADVLLFNQYNQTLEYCAGRGFRGKAIERSRLRFGEDHAGQAALERKIIVANLHEDKTAFTRASLLADEEFVAYIGAPLIAKGQVNGVLEVYLRTQRAVDDEWLDFLKTLAGQVAIAVDNANLFADLQRSNLDLFNAFDSTIEGWSHAMDLRDKETEGHTLRVTDLTLRLARAAGISEAELVHIRRGALLHDIGKIGVPDGVLLKPDKLTDEEWVMMRQHPMFAYEMISPIAYLKPALDIPYCHHEKWDGAGYPRGLKGEQIPLSARLFSIVDVYDALTSNRPYRAAWPKEKVCEHIQSLSGTHFDPKAVELFLKMMKECV